MEEKNNENYIDELIEKSRAAQAEFEKFNQQQVDVVVKEVAKVVFENAETLARMAVDETRMGNYEDKLKKKQGKARPISSNRPWNGSLRISNGPNSMKGDCGWERTSPFDRAGSRAIGTSSIRNVVDSPHVPSCKIDLNT